MVRRLNDAGVERFRIYLTELRSNPSCSPPLAILTDDGFSEAVHNLVSVPPGSFSSRYQAAEALYLSLSKEGVLVRGDDVGQWAWFSLNYFDTVCPRDARGARHPKAPARYIPEPSFNRYYRHLLAGPYLIYRANTDDPRRALCLLRGPVDAPGELVEQVSARLDLVSNHVFLAMATRLYVNPDTLELKRGAGGAGPGSPRRLAAIMDQLDLTWDAQSLSPEGLAELLPAEFNRFRT